MKIWRLAFLVDTAMPRDRFLALSSSQPRTERFFLLCLLVTLGRFLPEYSLLFFPFLFFFVVWLASCFAVKKKKILGLSPSSWRSRVESPEAGPMGYRTQSLDSMSSGHSSADHNVITTGIYGGQHSENKTSRKSIVRPFEDPTEQEESTILPRYKKKTTILAFFFFNVDQLFSNAKQWIQTTCNVRCNKERKQLSL